MNEVNGRDGGATGAEGLWAKRRRRVLAGVLTAVVACLTGLAVVDGTGTPLGAFDADGEYNAAAGFSALLLAMAASAAVSITRRWPGEQRRPLLPLALAVLLGFMAADELLRFHEWLESHLGVDWQIVFAPLALAGGAWWLALLLRMWRWRLRSASIAWLVGGVAWLLAQGLEAVQWDGDRPVAGFVAMMLTEEALEMCGSVLFLLALLGLLDSLTRSGNAVVAVLEGATLDPDTVGDSGEEATGRRLASASTPGAPSGDG